MSSVYFYLIFRTFLSLTDIVFDLSVAIYYAPKMENAMTFTCCTEGASD
jgi:hypothetical protein